MPAAGYYNHRQGKDPFVYNDKVVDKDRHVYKIVTVDSNNRTADSEPVIAETVG